jgi:hypothetical protein
MGLSLHNNEDIIGSNTSVKMMSKEKAIIISNIMRVYNISEEMRISYATIRI